MKDPDGWEVRLKSDNIFRDSKEGIEGYILRHRNRDDFVSLYFEQQQLPIALEVIFSHLCFNRQAEC